MTPEASTQAMLEWGEAEDERLRLEAPQLPFDLEEYRDRQVRLRKAMAAADIGTLVLTAPDTMCWLTGYDSRWYRSHSSTAMPPSQCQIVRADTAHVLHVETEAHAQLVRITSCADEFVPVPSSSFDHEPTLAEFRTFLADLLRTRGWLDGRVGLERWSSVPNPATLVGIEQELTAAGGAITDATALIRAARRYKSAAEIALIERAQVACDAGVTALADALRPGMTELQAWNLFMTGVVAAGGEPTAMHETVAMGPLMPSAHRVSSRRTIGAGDYVHADVAAAVHRYHARVTRMLWLGRAPAEVHRMTELSADALELLVSTAQLGMRFGDVAQTMSRHFDALGVPGWIGGYELGVAFPPDWVGEFTWSSSEDADDIVQAGLVTNVESCIGAIALVDTLVVTESGTRLLSSLAPTVIEVGR